MMRCTPELVLKVNEVFHDVEGAAYADVHPEIFAGEVSRWDELVKTNVLPRQRPTRVMDVGCGTGFVGSRVARVLTAGDTLVCADLSQAMLDASARALSQEGHVCRVEFVKLDGQRLQQPDESCDVVTMNSVLHHLPDTGSILREIDRVLKPGGVYIVAHEPNRCFYRNRWMRLRSRLVGTIARPRQTAGALIRWMGLMSVVHRLVRRAHHDNVLAEVNRRLLAENAIRQPLTQDQLTAIVDVQSPTAGGWHPERGIDIEALAHQHLPGYACRLTTYDHLGSGVTSRTGWKARYEQRIAQRHPTDGATLAAVLTKPAALERVANFLRFRGD